MEQQRTFSPIEALKYGFNTLCDHFFLLIGARLVFQAILDGLPLFAYTINPLLKNDYLELQTKISTGVDWISLFSQHTIFLIMMVFIYFVLISVALFGLIKIDLDIYDTASSSLSRLFSWVFRANKVVAVNLLLILFFIMGRVVVVMLKSFPPLIIFFGFSFYWLACYCFMRFSLVLGCLVDQNKSVYSAFVYSWRISSGNVLRLSILWFLPDVLHISFQSFGATVDLLGNELSSIMTEIIISQSLIYAYRQLSPARSDCRENKKECGVFITAQ